MIENEYEMEDLQSGGTKGDRLEFYNRMFNLLSELEQKKSEYKADITALEDEFGDLIDKQTRKSLKKLADLKAKQKLFDFETESNELIELKNELEV